MKKATRLATAVLAMALAGGSAHATVYDFAFASTDGELTANGEFFVTGNQMTGITGTITGTGALASVVGTQNITGIVANPSFPSQSTSSDGAFYYDNIFSATAPFFPGQGNLFTTTQDATGYWNMFSYNGGTYLSESANGGGYPLGPYGEVGTLSVTAVPELSTWAMMLVGFVGLGFAGYRRTKNDRAALAA